jgi:poly-gamma-glutamate capsule biosynthesis protein CapA/YwtB (metallophosphatase superfamily)
MMRSEKIWKVAIAGEAMASRPFSMHDEPDFLAMLKLLRESDATYAHLEASLGYIEEIEWAAKGEHTGSFFMVDPQIADDLKWAGVDIISNAFNHSGDFGPSGVLSTRRHCKRAGLVCAGTGKDLEEARAPGYLETKKGRVALVSITSGNRPEDWASLPKGGTRGRPGVNPLRVSMKYIVDHDAAEQLKEIGRKLNILKTKAKSLGGLGFEEGEFGLGSAQSGGATNIFIEGDRFEVTTVAYEKDLERNCRAVDEAMQMADLVMVGHHCNLSEGPRGDYPPKFMRVVAKALIDAGADIYIGHGWHKTLGIEIYKNRPIFYGIGNFFAQNEFLGNVPYDSYEAWGHDVDRLPTLNPASFPLHPGGPESTETWWSSAVVVLDMEGHKLTGMKLYPVEMGREVSPEVKIRRRTGSGPHAFTEGRPLMADRENGDRILKRIKRLSAEYGTKIEIENGIGVLKL